MLVRTEHLKQQRQHSLVHHGYRWYLSLEIGNETIFQSSLSEAAPLFCQDGNAVVELVGIELIGRPQN